MPDQRWPVVIVIRMNTRAKSQAKAEQRALEILASSGFRGTVVEPQIQGWSVPK